jgi:hypothetical protein
MARKKFRQEAGDPFQQDNTPVDNSWVQTDSEIFGGSQIFGDLAAADAQVERVRPVSIFDILPDLTQPRRAVPSPVRHSWDGTPAGIAEMLKVWWGLTEEERGGRFDLGAYLEGGETERSETDHPAHTPGPIEAAFMTIITLAASIRRDGLTNPITVAPAGHQHQLETGERRWLAYHLLYAWFDGHDERPNEQERWEKIPTRQVKQVDVWRQANENNARTDLNAISRARQLAILLMHLHGLEHFKPFEAFQNERKFYAQAAERRPPYGTGEQLLNAMGVSNRSALTRYRALLKLPDEIWQGGDDLNLPEETLYALARMPEQQALERFRQIVAARNNVDSAKTDTENEELFAPGTKRHFARLAQSIIKAGPGKHKHNAQALKALREMRIWLDEQEERISRYLD